MNFAQFYADLDAQATDILSAFTNAGLQLQTAGLTNQVQFLEIYYDGGGLIRRIYDDARVNQLPSLEQLRLYSQLNGLFIQATKELLYP
jgi:hypothetical protein